MVTDTSAHFDWTNSSVTALAGGRDPLTALSELVGRLIHDATQAGVHGPPTDPFELAEAMGIILRPHHGVRDARLLSDSNTAAVPSVPATEAPLAHFVPSDQQLVIEYNPTRPRGRLRYSVAHEIAHALFADAVEAVRHRTPTGAIEELHDNDSWQLELLCNIAAAEMLMPSEAVAGVLNSDTDIDFLMAERARLNVSTEALMRRLVHGADRPLALAAFSRIDDRNGADLRCDYVLESRKWTSVWSEIGGGTGSMGAGPLRRGALFESRTPVGVPVAVGQTSRGRMELAGVQLAVQAVGVPAYPGNAFPRILALFEPAHGARSAPGALHFVTANIVDAPVAATGKADAVTSPANLVIAHVVSDAARAWGGRGVAAALKRRFPDVAESFHNWTIASPGNLSLGNVHIVEASSELAQPRFVIASMVAQRGYGPSATPRLDYDALAEALTKVAQVAADGGFEVHLPRIGAGQAGGRWDRIQYIIESTLLAQQVPTFVYTMPSPAWSGSSKR